MAFEAVIFDIGGVLERNPRTGWEERWALLLGMPRIEFDRLLEPIFNAGSIGTISLDEVQRRIAGALGLEDAQLRGLMDEMWTEYIGTLNEELAAYFAALRPRYRTGILSNSFVGAREREQRAYGFEDMCDAVIYSHEEGVRKPDSGFYGIVCRRLDVSPGQAIFLDDQPMAVEGARRVGMTAVRFLDNRQAIAELNAHLGVAADEFLPPSGS
jgi:epoxide hydrolase-like predicted phosphatase